MNKISLTLLSLSLAAASGAALAADPAAGEAKADACLDCHMPEDFSGLTAAEIEAAISGILSGEAAHPADISDLLAEEDVPDVAAWFAHEGAE